ncbi:MAG: amino acid adenylation domain-containing protein, partial [Chitinophagaceae bacterium]
LVMELLQYEKKSGISLRIILMAAFKVLLRKYCGHDEIVIGTSIENRNNTILSDVIGPLANLIVLKSCISPGITFNEYVSSLNETYEDGIKYGELPFEKLVKKLAAENDMSRNALFDVTFQYHDAPLDMPEVKGLEVNVVETGEGYGTYDLALSLRRREKSIEGKLVFNSGYFNHDTIQSFADHYCMLIRNLLSSSESKLSGIDAFSADQRERLLNIFNYSHVAYPAGKTIIDLFKEQVKRSPHSIAVNFGSGYLTYHELDRKSDSLASALIKSETGTGMIIGLLTDRSLEMIIAMIGILKAGGAYLPIDVDYPDERIEYLIADSGTPMLLTTKDFLNKGSYNIPVLCIEDVISNEGEVPEVVCRAKPADLCYVIYTSGTTGNPKGVMVEHRNVVRLLFNNEFQYDFSFTDVWTMFHSHCFDVSVWEIYGALLYGGRLVVIPKSIAKDTKAYLDILREEGVTILNQTPSAFYNLSQQELASNNKLRVRYVIFAGEALSPAKLKEWNLKYPQVRLINMYGITETTVHSTYKEIGSYEIENNISNIGKPLPTLSAYLLDENGNVVPRGVIGELYIGGEGVTRGYLQKPELTSKVFLRDPYNITERVYKSGDLARILHTGELEYIGRIDHQVQLRGFRIELGEIESQLERHDQIKKSVVLANGKDEDKFLVAYYISAKQIDVADLRSFLFGKLPEYMVPSFFVRLESMPLTPNGKLDRKALPYPEIDSGVNYVAPENEAELHLVEIWAEILKTGKESISVDRSFFEMGGHSLNASVLVNRIARHFHTDIPLQDIFTYPDIRNLAKHINAKKKSVFSSIPRSAEKSYYKVTSSQKQLFFLHELNPSSLAYNMPHVERITGEMKHEKLARAFQKLVARHEILRSFFEVINGEVVQKVLDVMDLELEHYKATTADEEMTIKKFIRPFDLAKDPLLRAGLLEIDPQHHLLMLDMHHIINDGVSQSVIVKDFLSFYNGNELPPLQLQYKDYAEWQQGKEQQAEIDKQGNFWVDLFAGDIGVLDLPSDFVRPSFKNDAGAVVDFELTGIQAKQLKAIAEKEGCTLFMVLFAVYNVLLNKLSNQDDIIIGAPVAGRQHADVENMIGLFINILPLRTRLEGEQGFSHFLASLKSNVLACFENQSYPYEQLIEKLRIERDVSRNPLFDVLFLFQNFEDNTFSIPGMQIESYDYQHPVSKVDLTLSAVNNEDSISLRFEYATSLFKEATIKRFAGYFNRIVTEIISDSDKKIADIDILPGDERNKILYEFNKTKGHYDRESTIVSLFKKQADKIPDNVCVVFENRALTYLEVHQQSNQLAQQLREEFNVRAGDFVAVLLPRSEKMLIGLLAVLKSGAAYVPIDPSYPEDRIRYILQDSRARVLLADGYLDNAFEYEGAVLHFDNSQKKIYSIEDLVCPVIPDDLCYMIYTSGSTGTPKGVMISHKNVLNFFAGMNAQLNVNGNDSLLAVTSTAFDISVLELFWTICHGIEVVIYPSDTNLSDLDRYVKEGDRTLDFSLFFFSSYKNEETNKYNLLLESAAYADKEGFKAIWTPERHFHEFGGLYPNPSVVSAGLAMITKNIEIRSGSVVSPLHDVLRIAEEWSVVDNLSNGRVAVSFASGWNPDDFALSSDSYKDRHGKMYSQIESLKELWGGGSITRVNGLGKEVELRVFPRPVQAELPVWITSAGSPETFRSAGEKGTNVLTHFLGQDIKMLADNIQLYREARIQSGYDEGKVTIMLHTYIGDDLSEVEEIVRAPFIEYLKSSIGLSKVIFEQAGFKAEDLTDELKDKILNNSFRRYYKEGSLIGTIESCAGMIRKLKETGVDEIACLVDFGIDQSKVIEGLVRLKDLKNLYTLQELKITRPVTIMQSTPSFINLLLNDKGSVKFLNSLQTLLVGGEALSMSLLHNIRRRNDKLQIYNMYGPTETTIWSSTHKLNDTIDKISIGKPILNTQIYILNKYLQLVPIGVAGDLYIGGEGLSRGYWNRPELTAERFIQNPFNDEEKIYNTGDLAKWLPNGDIEYIGRKDYQVKIRGFRIELGEIEKCLRDIEEIKEAVVVARKGHEGEGIHLAAYIITDGLAHSAIRTELVKKLPYYMIPAHIVSLDKFPLTPNGKLDRSALPEPTFKADKEHVTTQTPEEELLVELWSKVLGIEGIGVTDNFFSIGGDSIKSIQIISRIRILGYELSVKDIFTTQNIRELALRLKKTTVSDQSDITGPSGLTPIQQWFFDSPTINKHHYNQAVMLTFPERLTPEMAAAIFNKIQTHHDALRMIFPGGAIEILPETKEPSLSALIEIHDLRNNKDPDDVIPGICDQIQASIDLSTGPLMKLGLFQLTNGSKLLIVIHHLVIDGISWRVLFEDIEALYQQIKRKLPLTLPLKTDPFQSWSRQLLQYSRTKEFQRNKNYWKYLLDQTIIPITRDYPGGSST